MKRPLLTLAVASERDVVAARQRVRHVAELTGFDYQDQIRIATAVSEIVRNATRYGGGGRVSVNIEGDTAPQVLQIVVSDRGPGIPHLTDVLEGRHGSETGMGVGIIGSRRLMDQFTIETSAGAGTTVTMGKLLPAVARPIDNARVSAIASALTMAQPQDPVAEALHQNRELLRALDDLRRRQDELHRLNRELEDTNRGVVALYAELDERADHLQRADEMKSKFLSNMSHEFRTPLNSMLALTRLLLERADGDLTAEQETQVSLVRRAAQDLSEIVNDLLDLAKVEAGKTVVRPADFEVANLFGALRGMLRPLLVGHHVELVFDIDGEVPTLHTDEAKVSQVLRNFISNALKFTEQGEVRVTARYDVEDRMVWFAVSDTGIGIAPEDHERIFQEFTQVESRAQRKVRGTGLGLPLSRRLAQLLGGRIQVASTLGAGSTFSMVVPAVFETARSAHELFSDAPPLDPSRLPVLIVEDAVEERVIYERLLRDSRFQPLLAREIREAYVWLERVRPAAIILDVRLHGQDSWPFLTELRRDDRYGDIPVLVVSAIDEPRKGLALGARDYLVKPVTRALLIDRLAAVTGTGGASVLIVDNDATARYVIRHHLVQEGFHVLEAADGEPGVRLAAAAQPGLVILDLTMPGLSGPETLQLLRADARTRAIPVIVATSMEMDDALAALGSPAPPVLSKRDLAGPAGCERLRHALDSLGVRLPEATRRHAG